MNGLPALDDIQQAADAIYAYLDPTPQINWPLLDQLCGIEVWVKHENHLPTGSFKVRGGIWYVENKVSARTTCNNAIQENMTQDKGELQERTQEERTQEERTQEERTRAKPAQAKANAGLIAATRGNHGQSIAFAARKHKLPVLIVVPEGNNQEKNAAMDAFGANLIVHGRDFDEAKKHAEKLAEQNALLMVPSFDPLLVAGVATYALELFTKAPPLDCVYVPIGLGSGICGVIAARDALGLTTDVVGVVSSNANAYQQSFQAGKKCTTLSAATIADGLAVRTPDDRALAEIIAGAARIVDVTEDEITDAMKTLFVATHNLAEGAGAASLAALIKEKNSLQARAKKPRCAIILSGGNVAWDLFNRLP